MVAAIVAIPIFIAVVIGVVLSLSTLSLEHEKTEKINCKYINSFGKKCPVKNGSYPFGEEMYCSSHYKIMSGRKARKWVEENKIKEEMNKFQNKLKEKGDK